MKYHLILTSSDPIGLSLVYAIVEAANLGATVKPGTVPSLRFPFTVSMELESDTPPAASPNMRVFDENAVEILPAPVVAAPVVAATFSVDSSDKPTKESLDAMEWTDLQALAKEAGITGRDRAKVTKAYLAKLAE